LTQWSLEQTRQPATLQSWPAELLQMSPCALRGKHVPLLEQ
jgi:hypothetical protein